MQRPHIEMPAGFKLADLYYVLFRRKWMIMTFLLLGAVVSLVVYLVQKPMYYSEAKLLVRYIIDTKTVESGVGTSVRSPDYSGETIINSELEILTSLDICQEVAAAVMSERQSDKPGQALTPTQVFQGLTVENPRRSNIIKIRFAHPNPEICRDVLEKLIALYLERHKQIHRAAGSYNQVLTGEQEILRQRIADKEKELRELKAKADVLSVDDAKRAYGEQLAKLDQEIFETEAALAEFMISTNGADKKATKTNNVSAPANVISEYKTLVGRIDSLRSKEFTLAETYTEEHRPLKLVRTQIAEYETRRGEMEAQYPALTAIQPSSSSEVRPDPRRAVALQARMMTLTNQLAIVRGRVRTLEDAEAAISTVERELQLHRQNYMHLAAGLEAAKFDEAIGAGKMSNIQSVQAPSSAQPNVSQRLKKVAGTFFGLIVAGLACAFIYEMFINRTVKRPGDFESKFKVPLFLSIPKMGLNGHAKMLPMPVEPAPDNGGAAAEMRNTWAPDHPLRPFIDGLRDRTLIHFENNVSKPKLIGVTSCSKGVGVTSIAAGLAGALSETGDGNVLLLNLNYDSQAVHPFFRGELSCGLNDALENDKRRSGMVLNNLYVATASPSAEGDNQNLSKQLMRVVPKLRVSDYDYIVFDLPPTTPTTPTARLSGMMDLVVLVVEAEKDNQDAVKQASQLLARAKAPVSAVLNKVNNPVPKWLASEADVAAS